MMTPEQKQLNKTATDHMWGDAFGLAGWRIWDLQETKDEPDKIIVRMKSPRGDYPEVRLPRSGLTGPQMWAPFVENASAVGGY